MIQESENMKYLTVVFFSVLVFDLTDSYYITYPSGVQVSTQQVQVIEVNEYGEEVQPLFPPYRQYGNLPTVDFRQEFIPARNRDTRVQVWVFKVHVIEVTDGLTEPFDGFPPNAMAGGGYGGSLGGDYCPGKVRDHTGACVKEDLD